MPMLTDELVKTSVVDHLAWDDRVDASNVQVTIDGGEVTLKGVVPSYLARLAAAHAALSVRGVNGLNNQLEVKYSDIFSDEEVHRAVENRILWNPYLFAYKIDVSMDKGWATLKGTVDAYWKKLAAEEEASNVRGVIGVSNHIAVVTTKDKDERLVDEAIAEDVVKAIDRNRQVIAENVDVKVVDGDVILSGEVSSQEARNAAYWSALYTFGVSNVHNHLVVLEPVAQA